MARGVRMANPVSVASIAAVVGDDVRLIMPGLRCCVPGFCCFRGSGLGRRVFRFPWWLFRWFRVLFRCATRPGWWFPGLVFRVGVAWFWGFVGVSVVFPRVRDTPVEWCVSNGFRGGRDGRVCVFVPCGVSFSLAAAQRAVPVGPVP